MPVIDIGDILKIDGKVKKPKNSVDDRPSPSIEDYKNRINNALKKDNKIEGLKLCEAGLKDHPCDDFLLGHQAVLAYNIYFSDDARVQNTSPYSVDDIIHALEKVKNTSDAQFQNLMMILIHHDRLARAVMLFRLYVKKYDIYKDKNKRADCSTILLNLSAGLINVKRAWMATILIEKHLNIDPDNLETSLAVIKKPDSGLLNNYILALGQMNRRDDCFIIYDKIIANGTIEEKFRAHISKARLNADDFNFEASAHELQSAHPLIQNYRETGLFDEEEYGQYLIQTAVTMRWMQQYDKVRAIYDELLQLRPNDTTVHINHGIFLENINKLDDAMQAFYRADELGGSENISAWHRAQLLLRQGNYVKGWRLYDENRFLQPDYKKNNYRPITAMRWHGEDLNNNPIFIHHEQGYGDVIMHARLVKQLKARGASHVTLEVQPKLVSLMKYLDGVDKVVSAAEKFNPSEGYYAPLLSLPHLLSLTADNIPDAGGYIHVPKTIFIEATNKNAPPPHLRIGLQWQGNPKQIIERWRQIPLSLFAPLLDDINAVWISLNPDEGQKTLNASPLKNKIIDVSKIQHDFLMTAQIINSLDLVITSCTSIAHLAGAMGKPVWLLLAKSHDWRWQLNDKISPWYSSMRLFIQPDYGDWPSVIKNLREALRQQGNDGLTVL